MLQASVIADEKDKKMIMSKRIDNIIEELIVDQYLVKDRYNRPWIIGFSGGYPECFNSQKEVWILK